MQNYSNAHTDNVPAQSASDRIATGKALPPIDPLTLARLNFGLFNSLRRLGTSQERICAALGLSPSEYDYISSLAEH